MGCVSSKARGISPELGKAKAAPYDDKPPTVCPAGRGAVAAAADAPPFAAPQQDNGGAALKPELGACSSSGKDTPFCSSGQSSWTMASSGGCRSAGCRPNKGGGGAADGPAPLAADAPPAPRAEAQRLAAVRLFCAAPPGESCSSVSTLLRASLDVPLAFVCLVGEEQAHLSQPLQPGQQAGAAWVAVRRGEAPGELSAQPPGGPLVVQDMAADARYRSLPCVAGPPHLACLAAAPLVASTDGLAAGMVYGSLVVADTKARAFSAAQLETLTLSAFLLVRDIEWAAQAALREQAQQAQQALLRCAQETVEGHADAMLAVDPARDGWPVLSCSKAAILAGGAGLQQSAGVSLWELFDIYKPGGALESYGSLRSMDSIGSPGLPPLPSGGAWMSSAPPAFSAILAHGSAVAERPAVADSLRQALGTPEAAQWLLAAGKPFSLSCRLRSPGQEPLLPSSSASGTLVNLGPLDGWAEEAADRLLPQPAGARWSMSTPPRTRAATRHLQHAAAQPATPGRLQRPGSLDSALAVMQQGSSTAGKEQVFAVSFAPCTPALLRSLGAASLPDLPNTAAACGSGDSTSGSTSGSAGDLPPCWIVTLRLEPEITSGSLQRAHSACLTNGEDVEAFLKPEALQDVRLGRLIGAGAYGRTYLGRWGDQRVAVKIIPTKPAGPEVTPVVSGATTAYFSSAEAGSTVYEEAAREQAASSAAPFMEALLSTSLEHPHIVKTLGFGMCRSKEGEEEVWVVQELCTCGTLARAVERGIFTDRATGTPRLQRVLLTAIEIASAIAFLHSKGLVHADLSGNNIMLNRSAADERGFAAMVGDFGLARPLDLRSSICTGTYGTPTYMSPEMISEGRLSPEVDIFSAGVLLHEMLCGQQAWHGLSVVQVVNMVAIMKRSLPIPDTWPLPLQELVRSCLSHDPKARPTARQLLAQLKSLLADEVERSLA